MERAAARAVIVWMRVMERASEGKRQQRSNALSPDARTSSERKHYGPERGSVRCRVLRNLPERSYRRVRADLTVLSGRLDSYLSGGPAPQDLRTRPVLHTIIYVQAVFDRLGGSAPGKLNTATRPKRRG